MTIGCLTECFHRERRVSEAREFFALGKLTINSEASFCFSPVPRVNTERERERETERIQRYPCVCWECLSTMSGELLWAHRASSSYLCVAVCASSSPPSSLPPSLPPLSLPLTTEQWTPRGGARSSLSPVGPVFWPAVWLQHNNETSLTKNAARLTQRNTCCRLWYA